MNEDIINEFESTEFFGVFLDEHHSWKNHIRYVEKTLQKL